MGVEEGRGSKIEIAYSLVSASQLHMRRSAYRSNKITTKLVQNRMRMFFFKILLQFLIFSTYVQNPRFLFFPFFPFSFSTPYFPLFFPLASFPFAFPFFCFFVLPFFFSFGLSGVSFEIGLRERFSSLSEV